MNDTIYYADVKWMTLFRSCILYNNFSCPPKGAFEHCIALLSRIFWIYQSGQHVDKSTLRPQETIQNALLVQSVKCLELSV